jgi:DNA-binding transcriptional ArsR family regulator
MFLAETPMNLDERTSQDIADLFNSLSDPSRVRIIAALLEGERNISAIVEAVGLSQSAVSHQMRTLRQMRIVRARKVGRQVFYCLDDEHIADLFRQGLEHARHE